MLWSARETIHERLRNVPELYRTTDTRLKNIAFELAISLYDAKQLADQPRTRWGHLKAAFRWM